MVVECVVAVEMSNWEGISILCHSILYSRLNMTPQMHGMVQVACGSTAGLAVAFFLCLFVERSMKD